MNISHNWLQTYFDKKIPDAETMAKLFPLNSFEIEGLEEVKDEKGNIIDTVIDAKILPDRAHYALSHKGIAEEVSFLTKFQIKDRFALSLPNNIDSKPTIKIENSAFCRRYIGRYVELGEMPSEGSPAWLKTALNAIGQRSISPIVDATNYVMYDIGQPLHAFDADKIKGNIFIRAAKEGEKIILLDGRELTLTTADNVIADDEGALVVAGAKGGKLAEISETTKRIMIESANFDPVIVRRTSTKYDIRSDSSKRFENEITQELAIHGMNNICTLINEMIPGSKFGPIVDEYPTKAVQKIINFDPAYLEERLGIKIPYDEAKEILEKMGVVVSENHGSDPVGEFANSDSVWTLTIPFERLDLVIKEDIVEEVGRVYGYDKVKGILPPTNILTPTKNIEHSILPLFNVVERIKNILVDLGFSEVSLYTLVEKGEIETAKPLARDKAFARADLTLGMMDCVHKNALNADLLGLTAIKIFEVGHVFSQESESVHLALGASQIKKVKNFKTENIISEAVKAIENGLSVTMNGKITNSKIGNFCVYEINLDQVVKNSKPFLESNTPYSDLNFEPTSTNRYQKFSLYPFIVRDIAVFVPESVTSETVWESIEKGIAECGGDIDARKLLVRHALFDTFKKDGKVSFAFRMIFQSMEKTLTDEEVNGVMTNINAVMKEKSWEVR